MEYFEYDDFLKESDYLDYQIDYVLLGEHSKETAYCYAHSTNDPNEMIEMTIDNGKIDVKKIPDWDFNVDDYLFDDLENNKIIKYMSIETHYNIWWAVDQIREDINHYEGLQAYLSYCQQHDISVDTIKNLGLEPIDIMDLYREKNGNYEIIASLRSCYGVFVLGENMNSPSPYVTWITTDNRSSGYRSGHYFKDMDKALIDLKHRAIDEIKIESNFQRAFFSQKEKKNLIER